MAVPMLWVLTSRTESSLLAVLSEMRCHCHKKTVTVCLERILMLSHLEKLLFGSWEIY